MIAFMPLPITSNTRPCKQPVRRSTQYITTLLVWSVFNITSTQIDHCMIDYWWGREQTRKLSQRLIIFLCIGFICINKRQLIQLCHHHTGVTSTRDNQYNCAITTRVSHQQETINTTVPSPHGWSDNIYELFVCNIARSSIYLCSVRC